MVAGPFLFGILRQAKRRNHDYGGKRKKCFKDAASSIVCRSDSTPGFYRQLPPFSLPPVPDPFQEPSPDGLGADLFSSFIPEARHLSLLVDPVELGRLPGDELLLLEPEGNLLLGVLDAVGAVADVAADVDGEVATDGAGGRGNGVGGTEDGCLRVHCQIMYCVVERGK